MPINRDGVLKNEISKCTLFNALVPYWTNGEKSCLYTTVGTLTSDAKSINNQISNLLPKKSL